MSDHAGGLMEMTGSIDHVFYFAGALLALAGILGIPLCKCIKADSCVDIEEDDNITQYHTYDPEAAIDPEKYVEHVESSM